MYRNRIVHSNLVQAMNSITMQKTMEVMNVKLKYNKKVKVLLIGASLLLLAATFTVGFTVNSRLSNSTSVSDTMKALMNELAENEICYVIGHKSPDTDTVCSAILLSGIMKEYGIKCEARISGNINNETKFVLENYGISVPEIMKDAQGKKIVLVDHSEYAQMISGMEKADVIGIFDHHAVGNIETNGPIIYESLNVGSTATVIYQIFLANESSVSRKTAYLIASAILSDTNNLTSNTSTEADRKTLLKTAKTAGISDIDDFYEKMSEAAESYEGMTDVEIFLSDYKEYQMSDTAVGIACVNAANQEKAELMKERMLRVMEEIFENQSMEHLFAVVKNRKDDQSVIIGYGDGASGILTQAFGSDEYLFKPAASRKKDVVPKLEEAYKIVKETASS